MGYRYRLHSKNLPGRPDLALVARKKAIFVHGCFWHRHRCSSATLPKSNREYWERKQNGNAARDKQNVRALRRLKWKVLIIWECEIRNIKRLQRRLQQFLADE
jgi:DNA mismatch endonuclease (patch repair protein)